MFAIKQHDYGCNQAKGLGLQWFTKRNFSYLRGMTQALPLTHPPKDWKKTKCICTIEYVSMPNHHFILFVHWHESPIPQSNIHKLFVLNIIIFPYFWNTQLICVPNYHRSSVNNSSCYLYNDTYRNGNRKMCRKSEM